MPEALTESFCERCGTRYEFAAPTHLNRLRKTRGLISGLRNYIMSQDTLSDAVGDAIRSEEESLASAQLEAFHESFNFCIQCRQYTCVNCWNDGAGRCRTCVPIAGTDDLIERFEASFTAQHAGGPPVQPMLELDETDVHRRLGIESWPSEDLSRAGANGQPAAEWPESEVAALADAPDGPVEADVEPELLPLASEPGPALGTAPEPALPEQTAVVAAGEPSPASWDADAPFELEPEPVAAVEEPEPVLAESPALEGEPEPEPVLAEVEAEPESAAAEPEPEPEPVLAEAEPEPEPPVEPEPLRPAPRPILPINETIVHIPWREPAPIVEPEAEPQPLAAERDDPALAARRAQLDLLGLGDPGEGPVGTGRANVLPYRSSGASVHPTELAARHAAGTVGGSFWEASAREVAGVMTNIGVQACGECGLSLSASARFCRRCGTRQARSA